MRSITASFFASVDGVVSDPYLFQFDSFDDDVAGSLTSLISRVDTVILGRVGYLDWYGYWPTATADKEFADFINGATKYVASRTLDPADISWSNASLIEGDMLEFVKRLKSQGDGGEIAVMGSLSVARQLLQAGLLDSLQFVIHPALAAKGRRFFEDGDPMFRLELKELVRTRKGNVLVTYGPRVEQEEATN